MCLNRHANKISAAATGVSVLLTVLILCIEATGIKSRETLIGYEDRLFDISTYHTVDILIDDWDGFLIECENEQYKPCSVVIDGEQLNSVGLRAKGNSSLNTVQMSGSQRYSLKIEFDHYSAGKTYHGLDKLCLNNIIQDNTYMKDYLAFQMMNAFDVPSPLCSYAVVTVNGKPWGLFLAVEGVEDSFILRNYGKTSTALYKPDTMGGGPPPEMEGGMQPPPPPGMNGGIQQPPPVMEGGMQPPPPGMNGGMQPPPPGMNGEMQPPPPPGMADKDVLLQYVDDNPDSYPSIFGSAKSSVGYAEKERMIRALFSLNDGIKRKDAGTIKSALDYNRVLRYFVVHNYTVNGDSYTGGMIHNYYLSEQHGKLSMIPWDYNLGFGSFQNRSASDAVNDRIYCPLSVTGDGSRPMAEWMLSDETFLQDYHDLYQKFVDEVDVQKIINHAYDVINPLVAEDEYDPDSFCSRDEFEAGAASLKLFCEKRTESIRRQLAGTISPMKETDGDNLVDTEDLDLSTMGSMGGPGGPGGVGGPNQVGGGPDGFGVLGVPGGLGGPGSLRS